MEFELDGRTYRLEKLGTREALDTLKYLQKDVRFWGDDGAVDFGALVVCDHEALERRLFREHAFLLNETGDWVPLGKELVANHFNGRVEAYFGLLVKQIENNFHSFLGGGWATSRAAEGDEPQEPKPRT